MKYIVTIERPDLDGSAFKLEPIEAKTPEEALLKAAQAMARVDDGLWEELTSTVHGDDVSPT